MIESREEFLEQLAYFKSLQFEEVNSGTRGQLHIPKLTYNVTGRWVTVGNHQALSKHTTRSVKFIAKYFATKLGVSYEVESNQLKFKGAIKLPKFKEVENKFYREQVLCVKCSSPDTIRNEQLNQVRCLSCQNVRIDNAS